VLFLSVIYTPVGQARGGQWKRLILAEMRDQYVNLINPVVLRVLDRLCNGSNEVFDNWLRIFRALPIGHQFYH